MKVNVKVVTMPTQTTTPRFAAVRAAIERTRAQLLADLKVADADLVALDAIDAIERTVADIVKRYPSVPVLSATDAPATPRPSKLKGSSKRASGGGKPSYTPAEDALIIAAVHAPGKDKDKFAALARDMPGRTAAGLSRHALDLKKPASKRSEPGRAEQEQVGSGTTDVAIEALKTLGAAGLSGGQARDAVQAIARGTNPLRPTTRDPARPVRDVSGPLIGNGPGDDRVYDYPAAYTSRNSD